MDNLDGCKGVQLENLQNRIALHGARMWQLPLTYLGLIAITLNSASSDDSKYPIEIVFYVLAILGAIMSAALHGANKRYKQTVLDAIELENSLGLKPYTHCDGWHSYPYYALMCFGILCCVLAAIYFPN